MLPLRSGLILPFLILFLVSASVFAQAKVDAVSTGAREATAILDAALKAAADREDAKTQSQLFAASLRAAAELGPESLQGRRLLESAMAARGLSSKEKVSALRQSIRSVRSDLRFQPVAEADRPKGWPSFTSVGEVEIKRYPKYRLARAAMGSTGDMGAFFKLFNHIKKNDIAMTAPVEMSYDEKDESATAMAFLYGDTEIGETGKKGSVEVVDVAPATMISIGMRGYDSEAKVKAGLAALRDWMASRPDLIATGAHRVMSWNGPSVQGNRRFFEIQIPVRSKAKRKI
jgi:SOUL heme-binding protein